MQNLTENTSGNAPEFLRKWGFWAVMTGAVALLLVFAQMVAPTLEPQPSAASQIGEIAGEVRRSAWQKFLGLPRQAPEVVPVSAWSYLAIVAPALGVIAVLLSLISGVLRENWRYSVYGVGFGAAAIVFHFFWWIALLIAGVVLLVAIIENMGDIFGFS